MITTPSAAANAYTATQQVAGQGVGGAATAAFPEAGAGEGFAQALQEVVGDMTSTAGQMDGAAAAMLEGNGDMVGLVTAVAESEVAIQTLVSVRDRVINAYEEIMRMPI
ncbi:MAG: flagellar hook-basal body complex protein FliE [Pseudomonadota bacterium]